MLNNKPLDKKCEKCGEPVHLVSWSDHYSDGSFEQCSKICYHWWDYGMEKYKPKWLEEGKPPPPEAKEWYEHHVEAVKLEASSDGLLTPKDKE